MPNFEVTIRKDYRDIAGLVLDCRSTGLAADGSLWVNTAPPARSLHTGTHTTGANASALLDTTKNWRVNQLVGKTVYNITDGSSAVITANTLNEVTATLAGGTDNDWDVGDVYAITTPRFGNPFQDVAVKQPTVSTVGGYKWATFTRTGLEHYKIPLDYGFLASNWTIAFDLNVDEGDTANNQTVLGFPNLEIMRYDGSGDWGYRHNATPDVEASGTMGDGTWALAFLASSEGKLVKNNVTQSTLPGTSSLCAIDAASAAGFIATSDGTQDGLGGALRGVQIWDRIFSSLELDFAMATLNPETDYSDYTRGTVELVEWTDDTGTTSRINPTTDASHLFYRVQKASGVTARLQISAEVDGVVLPDSELGGELFDLTPIETPSTPLAVYTDTGWSSVHDVNVLTEGHYSYLLSRSNGGGVVIHFDVENT